MAASDSSPVPLPEESSTTSEEAEAPAPIPPVPRPPTEAGLQFNQLNIQQIPQTALDRLSPDQITELLESTLRHSDKMDERRFRYAMDQAAKQSNSKKLNTIAGAVVAIAGFLVALVLTYMGNGVAAGIIATFLATIIAVVVGSKLLD